mgnify:FL=1
MDRGEYGFEAPWGTLLKVISILVTVLLLGIFGGTALLGGLTSPVQILLYVLVPMAIVFSCLLFVVRGYTVTEDGLSVRRLLWETSVPLGVIRSVEHDPKAMTGAIRTWGNGGLYSFSGRYRSGRLGSFRAFVNDYHNCVVIKTVSGTVVVSPGNPELFVEVLEKKLWDRA